MEARPWWDEGRDPTRNVRRVVLEEPPAKLLKQGGSKRGSASRQKNQEERAGVFQRAMQRAEEAEQALAKARSENKALGRKLMSCRGSMMIGARSAMNGVRSCGNYETTIKSCEKTMKSLMLGLLS